MKPLPCIVAVVALGLAAWAPPVPASAWTATWARQVTDVPADLRPLVAPTRSELRFVMRRYALDRLLLDGNYAGSPERLGVAADDPVATRWHKWEARRRSTR